MASKTALSEKKWKELEARYYSGESACSLAKEYGVSDTAIRKRYGSVKKKAESLAVQLVAVESEINKFGNDKIGLVRTYADRLMAIQNAAGDVAVSGMKIAKRVSEAMSNQLDVMTDAQLMDAEQMKPIMAAGMVANTHAKLGMDILNLAAKPNNQLANTDAVSKLNELTDEQLYAIATGGN